MKKILYIALLLSGLTVRCFAQNTQKRFSFEAPIVERIVKVIVNDADILQQPNARSGMIDHVTQGKILAVVGTSGNWYKVCNSEWIAPYAADGGNATVQIATVGYIRKSSCAGIPLVSPSKDVYDFHVVQSGRHKGVCLWYSYNPHEENWCGLSLSIGKQVGGFFILPYRINVNEYSTSTKRVQFKHNESRYQLEFQKSIIDGYDIKLDQLTDSDIDYLIENVTKMSKKSGRLVFFIDGAPNEMRDINYGEAMKQLTMKRY